MTDQNTAARAAEGNPAASAPQRALVVAAHPDDADFGAGGTLATWADEGFDITLVVCTRGDQGGLPGADLETLAARREEEQRAASAIVGVRQVRFLDGYRDGWLEPTWELQRQLVAIIREVRPRRLLLQSPERNYDHLAASHPDHLAAGEATLRAVYPAAENPHAWPELLAEGLEPFRVRELWLMAHPQPNHAVDITEVVGRKLAALAAHSSQTGHLTELEAQVLSWARRNAREHGLPEGRLAEVFKRVLLP